MIVLSYHGILTYAKCDTEAEAKAFKAGTEYVNDSAVKVLAVRQPVEHLDGKHFESDCWLVVMRDYDRY